MPRLGQHFLNNTSAITVIIRTLEIKPDTHIIEIGPGKGALTIPLLRAMEEKNAHITLIEKDIRLLLPLAETIKQKFPNIKPTYIRGDAVELLSEAINKFPHNTSYAIVGNIPYSITGALLRTISELKQKPEQIVIMVQKEVAERISAKAPEMNLLSAITHLWAASKILKILNPEDFSPEPKVKSALLKLTPINPSISHEELTQYSTFFKRVFKQPRKTLLNNLREDKKQAPETLKSILEDLKIPQNARPQDLTKALLIKLAQRLA